MLLIHSLYEKHGSVIGIDKQQGDKDVEITHGGYLCSFL